MIVPWIELLWEGIAVNGDFVRGQLFRFHDKHYICKNVAYTPIECEDMDALPPTVASWIEVVSSTLKRCDFVMED